MPASVLTAACGCPVRVHRCYQRVRQIVSVVVVEPHHRLDCPKAKP